jgi:hypothetical protein
MKHIIVAGLVTILLASCSGTANQMPSSSPIGTATESVETVIVATKTPLPPTQTPEITPIFIPHLNNLPSWLKDSNLNVLSALITDDLKRI